MLFRLDPETAHNFALSVIAKGWVKAEEVSHPVSFFGVEFRNRVGLAAGFDKNGIALSAWKRLGFGFVEIGTVTRHAQPGNDKPRLFRLIEDQGLINRMGFNNNGADAMARRLENRSAGIAVGINLGKSKVTELDDAAEDYGYSFKLLRDFGDYFVVNVSSPNTPGLRELQDKSHLTRIFWRLKEIDDRKPLLVKIAPDLTEEAIDDVASVVADFGLNGVIATNTTIGRDGLTRDPGLEGGLSGKPVFEKSNAVLARLRERVSAETVLVGVGGIFGAEDARKKIELGADLVQVYSGWVYRGPDLIPEIARALS